MPKIYIINKQRSLIELKRRMNEKANGVKTIMAQVGIEKDKFDLQDIYELSILNPSLFRELCEFLYPELIKYNAPADGADAESDEYVLKDEAGEVISEGKQSSIDWNSIINTLVTTSGGVLTSVYGTRQDMTAAAQLAQQKKDMRTMFFIIAIAVIIIITFAYLVIKHKK